MISPIKYRLYNNQLWVKSGRNEKWVVAKQYNHDPKIVTPISQNYGKDFIWKNLTPIGWKGRYVYRDISGYPGGHPGIDFTAPIGTCIYAPFDGIVTELKNTNAHGLRLKGSKYESYDLHLSEFIVNLNQQVNKGDLIALSGNTGRLTTAPHLHKGIRLVDWDRNDPMKGYFDFRSLIEDLDVYKLEEKEGMVFQHSVTGAVYEYRDGFLYHLSDKFSYIKNKRTGKMEKHYPLIDFVLKKMKKGIPANSLRGMKPTEFIKYKNIII